jgi:hypothetical protein
MNNISNRNESLSISNLVLIDVLIDIREDNTAPTAAFPPAAALPFFAFFKGDMRPVEEIQQTGPYIPCC